MTPKAVYDRIVACDKALKVLTSFDHMSQVKREERSRWVHELNRQSKLGVKEATKFRKMVKA